MSMQYARLVRRSALFATIFAFTLLLIKTYAWWRTGSITLLASLVDSLVDIAASLTNLIVVRYSLRPADKEHTFGHGKAESLAALAQSTFICGSAVFLFLMGFQRLLDPEPMPNVDIGIVITIFSLVTTLGLVTFQRWVVKKTGSQAIQADMLHYQSDLLMNSAIILALLLSAYGFIHADALFSLAIGGYILYSAIKIAFEAVQSLLDRALPIDERYEIAHMIESCIGVIGVHHLRTRRSGATRFIQMHLELDDDLPLVEAHNIADSVEQCLLARFPQADIIIHLEPTSIVPESDRKSIISG